MYLTACNELILPPCNIYIYAGSSCFSYVNFHIFISVMHKNYQLMYSSFLLIASIHPLSSLSNSFMNFPKLLLPVTESSRGCQVIATNFFATFSSIFPIKPLFWNRGRYIVVTKSAGRM